MKDPASNDLSHRKYVEQMDEIMREKDKPHKYLRRARRKNKQDRRNLGA